MKEVLFDFEEFMDRIDGPRSNVHAAYTRKDSNVFVSYTFRLSFLATPSLVVVYEKSLPAAMYGDEEITAFKEECRELAEKAGATPGYYEDAEVVQ